jgi:hypothetical protein
VSGENDTFGWQFFSSHLSVLFAHSARAACSGLLSGATARCARLLSSGATHSRLFGRGGEGGRVCGADSVVSSLFGAKRSKQ